PAVDASGGVERGTEQVGGAAQVLQRELDEQHFVALADGGLLADAGIVGAAVADRLVEDRGIGGEPGDAVLVDVALQRAVVENLAGDVVQPQALAEVAQGLQVGHVDSCCCDAGSVAPAGAAWRQARGPNCCRSKVASSPISSMVMSGAGSTC